jgi:hypothetical protein
MLSGRNQAWRLYIVIPSVYSIQKGESIAQIGEWGETGQQYRVSLCSDRNVLELDTNNSWATLCMF